MIPPQFDYHCPGNLLEAITLMASLKDDAKVMSGGQSLLPMLKLRLASPAHIVDVGRVAGMDQIVEEYGYLRIAGMVTEAQLERHPVIAARWPILVDTARVIADPLVRNRATVAGNLAHGDPANDHPATMIALRAQAVANSVIGERPIPVEFFFKGLFTTALQPHEILTEIRIPLPINVHPDVHRTGGAYLKLERKVGDYAVAGVAVQLWVGEDGTIVHAGIGLTNLGFTPLRAKEAEKALQGRAPGDAAIAEAAEAAAAAADPVADRRGSVEYKKNMARVLTERAIRKALERAGG